MTPDPTPAQLEELNNWLRGVDDRTLEQLKADLREMGDGTHPRSLAVGVVVEGPADPIPVTSVGCWAHQGPGGGL